MNIVITIRRTGLGIIFLQILLLVAGCCTPTNPNENNVLKLEGIVLQDSSNVNSIIPGVRVSLYRSRYDRSYHTRVYEWFDETQSDYFGRFRFNVDNKECRQWNYWVTASRYEGDTDSLMYYLEKPLRVDCEAYEAFVVIEMREHSDTTSSGVLKHEVTSSSGS